MISLKTRLLSMTVISAAVMALASQVVQAADVAPEPASEFQRALFDDATFTLHLRNYLLDRFDNAGSDPGAWALGGWAGYETGWIADVVRLGVVGYTSQPLWGPDDRDGALLLYPGQKGYSVLGQAYVALKFEEQILTVYRHIVNQPEVNAQDNRMTPNTFEGGSLQGDIGPVRYYAGVLTAMKKRNAVDFVNMAGAAGVNDNEFMYLGGLEFSPLDEVRARTSFYVVPNLLASSYSDASWTLEPSADTKLRLGGQFMIQSGVGDELLGGNVDAWMGGLKGDFTYRGLTLTAGYTVNGRDNNWQAPYGSWPGYTGMIVKDFNRADEQAALIGASFDFGELGVEGLGFTALAAFDVEVDANLPEWTEYDFTADYRFTALGENAGWEWLAPLWLRARYALVETDNADGTQDRLDDFRVILNYEVQFHGSDL